MSGSSSSVFKLYSWEREEEPSGYSWEADDSEMVGVQHFLDLEGDEAEEDDSSDDDREETNPGEALREYLLEQHASGHMTAKQISIISFLGEKAGIAQLSGLGLPTDNKGTGDYKRKVDQYLKKTGRLPTNLYVLPSPMYDKAQGRRSIHDVYTLPMHEVVDDEMQVLDVPTLSKDYQPTPNYSANEMVRECKKKGIDVAPLSVFMDGVQISKKDSVLAVTVQNLWSGKRFLVAGIRKKKVCRCGCRGFCTFFQLFTWMAWSLKALHAGKMPGARHDGTDWTAGDAERSAKAGSAMKCPALLVQLRADWAELVQILAAPAWRSVNNPCFLCQASRANMWSDLHKCNAKGLACEAKNWSDLDAACKACEFQVEGLTKKQWKRMTEAIVPNKELGGCILSEPMPDLKLVKGDRLEPSMSLPNWSDFFERRPLRVVFWRSSAETMVKHRIPLFGPEWNCTPQEVICLDAMHTLCLGVHSQYVLHSLWHVLDKNTDGLTLLTQRQGERHEANMDLLRADLLAWYKAVAKEQPDRVVTQLSDLSMDVVGRKARPVLRAKAHETLSLLRWLDESWWPKWEKKVVNGESWRLGAQYLHSMWKALESAPVVVPAKNMQDLCYNSNYTLGKQP